MDQIWQAPPPLQQLQHLRVQQLHGQRRRRSVRVCNHVRPRLHQALILKLAAKSSCCHAERNFDLQQAETCWQKYHSCCYRCCCASCCCYSGCCCGGGCCCMLSSRNISDGAAMRVLMSAMSKSCPASTMPQSSSW